MEFLFEFLREGRERVRSNAFVSVSIAFTAINWREIFFVVFADVSAYVKINYFDANTDWVSLFILPILVGVALALVVPFLNDNMHKWVSKPQSNIKSRDEILAVQRAAELEEERARLARASADRAQAEVDGGKAELEKVLVKQRVSDEVIDEGEQSRLLATGHEMPNPTEDYVTDNAAYWLGAMAASRLKGVSKKYDDDGQYGYYMGDAYFAAHHDNQDFPALEAALDELIQSKMVVKRGDTFLIGKSGEEFLRGLGELRPL